MNAPARRQSWHDAADVQADLFRWIKSPAGNSYLLAGYQDNAASLGEGTQEMLSNLYGTEPERLASADPIFVSNDMVDVVDAAMGRFEPEPFLPADLMTMHGFLYYERPFEVPDRFDRPVSIQGFSWMPFLSPAIGEKIVDEVKRAENPTDRQNYARAIRDALEGYPYDDPEASVNGVALTVYAARDLEADDTGFFARTSAPALVPIHFTPWWFGMEFKGNEIDENGVPTGAGWWWRILQTTLRLMQQRLTVSHRYRPDRDARRKAKKLGWPDDRDVIVVRLRREATPANGDGPHDEAHYSHRFIVGGHWRWQPYPSEGVVRQIYIAPYVKGPEDAPLIVRPNRAFNWSR